MTCARCGKANRENARFCDGCGSPLAPRCPACGAEARPEARFCDGCGTSLAGKPAVPAEVRKIVTIVFADLIGSTSLQERLDPESVSRVMDHYYRAVRAPIEAHGGTVVQFLGDGVMCAFGVPRVAEDDAIRAVRAAVGMQEAFREFARAERDVVGSVGLRVAVNTGEVVVSDERAAGIGDPLNVAARLQQEARDGDVLIGEATERLVRDLVTLEPVGTFSLRGRSETVRVFRVLSLERPRGAAAVGFVGRDDELRRLLAVYESAVGTPAARLAAILGSPGVGKSRLLAELARRLGAQTTMLAARCDAAGGGTFAPLADALQEHLGLPDAADRDAVRAAIAALVPGDESTRIATGIAALLAGTPAPPEETFFVVRRLLGAIAAPRPVVLTIDDVQWAEPLLLDLIEHLVQWSTSAPLLVLVAARPELRDTRSSLAAPGGLVSAVVTLGGLDASAATRLAANVIGADELPAAIAGRVLATSEGNPLFVGELVRMLVHDGILRREGDRWTTGAELASFEMPPTIHALLAARIERLRPAERTVLERAAVVGRQFSRAAVANLLPADVTDLDARLEALRRSELIEPDTGWLLGEPVMRFHHVLIRDAAYRRVLKGTRAELHERFADWLESRIGEAVEHDETLGWHLEQAHQHLRELGPLDAKGRVLGERAAQHLGAAGRRALARDDLPLAGNLLGRALERLDADDPARADLALEWCEALLASGDVGPAAAAVDELGRLAAGSERLRAWHTCFAGQRAILTDPQSLRPTADAVAAAAETLTAAGDAAGEAKAHAVQADALGRLGEFGACEAALDRALAAARRARDRRRANAVLAGAPLAALWGPSPVTRASGRCLDVVRVLRITQGAPAVEAVALRCQAVLEALRGRTEAARRMIAASRRMVEELGITQRLLEADMFAGMIELLEGDAAAAERFLRGAYEGLRRQGLRIDAAHAAALLGRALLAAGKAADAEALSHESEALAGDDLKAAIAWRGVRAEALAQRGEHTTAVTLARAAVDIAAALDALLDHADARLALAAALRAAGRSGEAAAEEMHAIELWEAKGATLLAGRARRGVEPLARFDELRGTSDVPTSRRVSRRIEANAAITRQAELEAAIATGDRDPAGGYADDLHFVHHPTGVEFGAAEVRAGLRMMLDGREARFSSEPLAALGPALALSRVRLTHSEISIPDFAPFGAIESDWLLLMRVNERGLYDWMEVFADDKLEEAVTRLYARYAEDLPAGPARERASATASSIATHLGPPDVDRIADAMSAAIELVDHRVLGTDSGRGIAPFRRGMRALFEVADDVTSHVDDVLGLRSDMILLRRTSTGRVRASDGAFERQLLQLWIFGPDGLLARCEQWEVDRAGEALARFDELSRGARAVPAAARRPRTNAATANVARHDAAVAARDLRALEPLFADELEVVHHPTAVVYDRAASLNNFETLFREAEGLVYAHTPLATLGPRLALFKLTCSTSGSRTLDHGTAVFDRYVLSEVDEAGRRRRIEHFAEDRLGAATARLYARYAELLPDGPARARAAATARTVAASFEVLESASARAIFAPAIEVRDNRRLASLGPSRGRPDEVLRYIDVIHELGDRLVFRIDEILDLRSDAYLLRRNFSGVGRESGGTFDSDAIVLWTFKDDGRANRVELFDADRRDDALARFETLATTPAAPRFSNAAVRAVERFSERWLARDWDGVKATFAPVPWLDDRRRLIRMQLSGEEYFAHARSLFATSWTLSDTKVLATRGERLALFRLRTKGDVHGVETAADSLWLVEVDAQGRRQGLIIFDIEDVEAAYAELDDRYAAGEGAPYAELLANMRLYEKASAERDWETVGRLLPSDFMLRSHRRLVGIASAIDREEYLATRGRVDDLNVEGRIRTDHVPRIGPKAALTALTWYGTVEGGEFEDPFLVVTGHDGRYFHSAEIFDLEQFDAAVARYETLITAEHAPTFRFENAATRMIDRVRAAWNSRDWDRFAALFASATAFQVIDRRKFVQLTLDRQQFLKTQRPELELPTSHLTTELIATRGDRLAMFRGIWRGSDGSTGPMESEWLGVVELDERGDHGALIAFDPEDIDAAYVELGARFDAGEAAPYGALADLLRGFQDAFARHDWETLAERYLPDLIVRDHRPLGWEEMRGRDPYVRSLRSLAELAPEARFRLDHVLGLNQRACLVVFAWTGMRDGGAFEDPKVSVVVIDGLGRVERIDTYLLDQLDAARARFAEASAKPTPPRIENLATRLGDRMGKAWQRGDRAAWEACFPRSARVIDRRKHAQLVVDGEQFLEGYRGTFFGMTTVRLVSTTLGTRGNRLGLGRNDWTGTDDLVGPSEIPSLNIIEVDPTGRLTTMIFFDPDDLAAAWAELDARYEAGEASEHELRSVDIPAFFTSRNWDALQSCLSPDLVVYDHRLVGWETMRGPGGYVASLKALAELAPDATIRVDHTIRSGDANLSVSTIHGTREGGAFETPRVVVSEQDAGGRFRRLDFYDLEQLDQAKARFAELSVRRPAPPIETAAKRMGDRLYEAWRDRDWDRFAALVPQSFRAADRRRLVQLVLDREQFLEGSRGFFAMPTSLGGRTVLATRGDRLELARISWKGSDALVGPSEIDFMDIIEVNAAGNLVGMSIFDADDLDGAFAELDERYQMGEGAAYPPAPAFDIPRFLVQRDWDGLRKLLSPDLVVYDHRPLGWETLRGPDAYVRSLQSLVELAPDARIRADHFERCERGGLVIATVHGTREGGAFEAPRVVVHELDAQGRQLRLDFYNLDQLDEARARYAEIRASARLDPVAARVRPNAACVAVQRMRAAFEARDWSAFRAACRPDMTVDDRRRHVQMETTAETWFADYRRAAGDNAHYEVSLVAALGERVAVHRKLMRGGRSGAVWEFEFLWVVEVDEAGRIAATISFDLDDWRAANREAFGRWFSLDPLAAASVGPIFAFVEAFNDREPAAIRARLTDDFVLEDRRRSGLGVVEDPDAYVRSLAVLWELAPDAQIDAGLGAIAYAEHGSVNLGRHFGTRDGGPFETLAVRLAVVDRGRIKRFELFELEHVDAAVARFEELRPARHRDATRDHLAGLVPLTAACAAVERVRAAYEAHDWSALRAACRPDLRIEDRRRQVLVEFDLDRLVADYRAGARENARLDLRLLSTVGDRVAVYGCVMRGGHGRGPWEVDMVQVIEVDEAGRVAGWTAFDIDDRPSAAREASRRWMASDAVAAAVGRPLREFSEALNERNAAKMRALLADNFVIHDHRRVPVSSIEGNGPDALVASVRVFWELAPDLRIETLRGAIAYDHRGVVSILRSSGTLPDGGAFENFYVHVAAVEGGRFTRYENFELEDLDAAMVCFRGLRPDPMRIPPNTATRSIARLHDAINRRDWPVIEEIFAPSLVFDDRRRAIRLGGDRDMLLQSLRTIVMRRTSRVAGTVLATAGDRLTLQRSRWSGGTPGGEFEVEYLGVYEFDAEGRLIANVCFDLDDRRAASRELFERFTRSAALPRPPRAELELLRAFLDHDLAACRAALPADFVMDDHRRTGMGRIEGADAYMAAVAALFAQAPDAIVEPLYHVARHEHGLLTVAHTIGTLAEGGEFESVYVWLARYAGDGFVEAELYEVEDLDVARARFEEIRPRPVLVPPNAASRARDRADGVFAFPDWQERFRALVSDDFVFDDRSKRALVSGGVELAIGSYEQVRAMGVMKRECELIGTMGDRIAVQRVVFRGGPAGGEFEVERLRITEVDAAGRITTSVNFDPEDRKQAFAEGHARFRAGAADTIAWSEPISAFFHAYSAHDPKGMRRCLADDLFLRDHRAVGVLDGLSADDWVESLKVHTELAPDVDSETFRIVAYNRLGSVDAYRIFGTANDGGAFESMMVRAVVTDGTLIRHYEIFDVGDLDRALARFDELSAASSAARAAG